MEIERRREGTSLSFDAEAVLFSPLTQYGKASLFVTNDMGPSMLKDDGKLNLYKCISLFAPIPQLSDYMLRT